MHKHVQSVHRDILTQQKRARRQEERRNWVEVVRSGAWRGNSEPTNDQGEPATRFMDVSILSKPSR